MIDIRRTVLIYMAELGDDGHYAIINIIPTAGRESERQGGV
jgi:hypothetical protein